MVLVRKVSTYIRFLFYIHYNIINITVCFNKIIIYNLHLTDFQDNTNITLKDYLSSTFHHADNMETNSNETQIKEDEVKSVSISRRSLENLKKQLIRIKQGQTMSTIPHSPQSPF